VVRDFKRAWEARDIAALIGLLDPDATIVSDSGGLVPARLVPIVGGEQIARAAVELLDVAPGLTFTERMVNGQPGLIAEWEGALTTVFAFGFAGERITHIWAVRNPEKLRPWTD
jgi:RNA polymerase sigma-70 factor (ECF subfamily)